MIKKLDRDSNTITIASFWENHQLSKYNFNPPYQRRSIWSDEKQSFLIDSILRNFPIPPIFLHQKIDHDTGSTQYDVIDGKQRLSAIIRFIGNEISVSNEFDSYPDDKPSLAGKSFADLNGIEFTDIKKSFWSYKIPIESLDTTDDKLIDDIFDRLNRNGEPLTGQELRNAQYHDTALLEEVSRQTQHIFWKKLLENLDLSRMEDQEFISELFFELIEGVPLEASSAVIDQYYKDHGTDTKLINEIKVKFLEVTEIMKNFSLDYEGFRIKGVSHLYGIWSFAMYCHKNNIDPINVADKLKKLFDDLRKKVSNNVSASNYKETMSSRTKSKSQRTKRLDVLVGYCIKIPKKS